MSGFFVFVAGPTRFPNLGHSMINVFGHLNPDSDAICSAVATAWWLNQRGQRAKAWRLGEMNRETQFIFQQAGVSAPELLQGSLKDKPVWLVDFTEPAQGPETLEESLVLGVIDHHRLGGLFTREPADICIKPFGCSATVLWETMSPEIRRALPPSLATLMLGAILSDTIAFRSPTTTETDRQAATRLSALAGIDCEAFSSELLQAKTDIRGIDAQTLLHRDLKSFTLQGKKVFIAQIELASLRQVAELQPSLLHQLETLADETSADICVLMLTDISHTCSELFFSGPARPADSSCCVPGMLSRKKQLLPWLDERLNELRRTS